MTTETTNTPDLAPAILRLEIGAEQAETNAKSWDEHNDKEQAEKERAKAQAYRAAIETLNAQKPAEAAADDTMPPHQRRVINERADLEDRLDKLTAFLASPTFEALPEAEQERLVRQSGVMVQLSDVLAERIAAF